MDEEKYICDAQTIRRSSILEILFKLEIGRYLENEDLSTPAFLRSGVTWASLKLDG